MVAVTLLFCANLLGLFEIRLPSNLNTRLATSGGQGLGGHFLQGSFATLLATPCSAPSSAPLWPLRWRHRSASSGSSSRRSALA